MGEPLRVVGNLPRDARGAHVANALSVDAGIRVSKVYAKRVLGDATGLTKAAFREAFTELLCLIDYLNSEEGKCCAFVRWTDGAGRVRVNNNIRYFAEYAICAKGIRDFVASVGVPFFSFDACHAKHLYYRGVYGNGVALVDTKPESLTNCEIAMTTDPESEQESLYESLFKVMRSAELFNRMKEESSVVISDDVDAFHNAAKAALGNGRRLASCA